MIVAGLGFRSAATLASLKDALEKWAPPIDALATAEPKSKAEPLRALAKALDVPVFAVSPADLQGQTTVTQSEASQAVYGSGSVAEAAALAAAGPGARLLGPRKISTDGMATCALAMGESK